MKTTSESAEGTYVFYESAPGMISYTLAKGDRVPSPADPTPHSEKSTWNFIRWLYWNSTTDSFRRNKKEPSDASLTTFAFDFSGRVTENTRLITSWTENKPQIFTFTVENQVENGAAGEEFLYTFEVSDEEVYGKIGGVNSNRIGPPDLRWGSVTAPLKNGETYTVRITVMYITDWGGANSVEIEILDAEGSVIRSGQVIYCDTNKYKNFVSDYKYTLTISQAEKDGYETTVAVTDNASGVVCSTDEDARSFTFLSSTGRSAAVASNFPNVNSFVQGQTAELTVVFTNTAEALAAPTGVAFRTLPYALMLGFGALIGAGLILSRRKREGKAN